MFSFDVKATCSKARLGELTTPHGAVVTPAFMPCGTAGAVRGVTPDQLHRAGAQMVLANTYHLMLRPGAETVAQLGGLHAFSGWDSPVLTDSGGYQVFSLAHMREIDERGVRFRSHVDGSEVSLTAERAVEVQHLLGADVMMQLDECPAAGAEKNTIAEAVRRSADWAKRCADTWRKRFGEKSAGGHPQALFGIQQGGTHADLRASSAEQIVALDLPGYAVGGLSVGEGHDAMTGVLDAVDDQFPRDKPRYLMGVGEPRDILSAVARGVDLFDCVLPTRNGRNAQAFTRRGRLRLRNARWAKDPRPLCEDCDCPACRSFSRGAVRHFFCAGEMLGPILVSIHNLHFFFDLMRRIRCAIDEGTFHESRKLWLTEMYAET